MVNDSSRVGPFQVLLKRRLAHCRISPGENSKSLPTDTMKEHVYSLARSYKATSMGTTQELTDFLCGRKSAGLIRIESASKATMWRRLTIDGEHHPQRLHAAAANSNNQRRAPQGASFHILLARQSRPAKTVTPASKGTSRLAQSLTRNKDRLFGPQSAPSGKTQSQTSTSSRNAQKSRRQCYAPCPITTATQCSNLYAMAQARSKDVPK